MEKPDFLKDIDTPEKCQSIANSEQNDYVDCLDKSSLKCFRRAYIIAKTSGIDTVLILGPNGCGKSGYAKIVWNYNSSNKEGKEPLSINCAAFNDELFISEMFGHKKGSFSGATTEYKGRIKEAEKSGQCLFLDEIGELSPKGQAALLRFLQNGEIQPIGSTTTETVKGLKVICATNRDLEKEVQAGRFRQDLLARIRKFVIKIPPLNDRPKDRFKMAQKYLETFKRKQGNSVWTTHLHLASDFEVKCKKDKYAWPRNFRELECRMYQAIIDKIAEDSKDYEIHYEDLFAGENNKKDSSNSLSDFGFPIGDGKLDFDLEKSLQKIRELYIGKALEQNHQQKNLASAALGYSDYQKMDRKYKKN